MHCTGTRVSMIHRNIPDYIVGSHRNDLRQIQSVCRSWFHPVGAILWKGAVYPMAPSLSLIPNIFKRGVCNKFFLSQPHLIRVAIYCLIAASLVVSHIDAWIIRPHSSPSGIRLQCPGIPLLIPHAMQRSRMQWTSLSLSSSSIDPSLLIYGLDIIGQIFSSVIIIL